LARKGTMGLLPLAAAVPLLYALAASTGADEPTLTGFAPANAPVERGWESKFLASPSSDTMRETMRRLSARPHHVGSAYDKENAEWIAARFKEWGLEAKIETFDVLFPTPQQRLVEMLEPTKVKAKLEEPVLSLDPTSSQRAEQLPTYLAYSIDGDVTGHLVY